MSHYSKELLFPLVRNSKSMCSPILRCHCNDNFVADIDRRYAFYIYNPIYIYRIGEEIHPIESHRVLPYFPESVFLVL